jgi:two-component system invasion response regulator UvrY
MKILVVDDHPVVQHGLKGILLAGFRNVVVGEAGSEAEAFKQIRGHEWDLILLDITMPGRGGLEILKQVKREKPKLPVLILSIHSEDLYAVRALKAGASGYLTKDTVPEKLVSAIHKVISGGKFVSEVLAEKLADGLAVEDDKPPHEILSDREYEVMRLLASGKRVRDIARTLSLSEKTISTFRARIYRKLKLTSYAQLIHYGLKHNLTE